MLSGISKWVSGDISQDVCPWNVRFAQPNTVPELAPREVLAGKDARTLARELLAMSQEEFSYEEARRYIERISFKLTIRRENNARSAVNQCVAEFRLRAFFDFSYVLEPNGRPGNGGDDTFAEFRGI